jgi:hypothetical protein
MATSRRPSPASGKTPERPPRKSTQRLPASKVQTATATAARPDPATAQLLQILAEEIEELRADLHAVREEVAVLRAVVSDRKVTGSYRGITRLE